VAEVAADGGSGSSSVRCSTPAVAEAGEVPAAVGAEVDLAAVASVAVAADLAVVLEVVAVLVGAARAAVGKLSTNSARLIRKSESLLVFRHPKNRWLTQLCMTH
jgi:hypothetical protein